MPVMHAATTSDDRATDTPTTPKKLRGFAALKARGELDRMREIASRGGRTASARGVNHRWTSEEAREAGRKGGSSRKRTTRAA